MTSRIRILLPVQTYAEWGGLQDWTVGMVRGLASKGADVALVSNNDRIIEESIEAASETFRIDWTSWRDDVDRILDVFPCDVIFAQPFASRELALELRRHTGTPLVYMAHGNNSDYAYAWKDEASAFFVASSSLVPMMTNFCGIQGQPVGVLPTAVPSELFDHPVESFAQRTARGSYDIVLASRLMPDKLSQIDALIHLVSGLLRGGSIPRATLHLMGGGASTSEFLSRLGAFVDMTPNVEMVYHGWLGQGEVLSQLRSAVFAVGGGVTGAQSVALGTPCLGAGFRGICGVSTPENMDRVLGSNFGDHSSRMNMSLGDINRDAAWILQSENFTAFQRAYVPLMRDERTHESIAEAAIHGFRAAIDRMDGFDKRA